MSRRQVALGELVASLLVTLPAVNVLGLADLLPAVPLVVRVETDPSIALSRLRRPTCRTGEGNLPGPVATGDTASEVAADLGCDWHTVTMR